VIRCSHCDIVVAADAERCPQCLRKSTLVDPGAREAPMESPWDLAPPSGPPSHAGVRFFVLLGAWVVLSPFVWLVFAGYAWLERHHVWLGGVMAAFALTTIPLRVAFERLDEPLDARRTARRYALLMLFAPGSAAAMFVAGAAANRIAGDGAGAVFLAVLFFLVGIFCAPVLVAAVRGRQPWTAVLPVLARNAGIAVLIVAGLGLVVALRAGTSSSRSNTIVIPSRPSFLDDLERLRAVPVHSARVPEADGLHALHLQADAGDVKSTLTRLESEAMEQIAKLRDDATASGHVHLWLPPRFETPEDLPEVRSAERVLGSALADQKTAAGRPIHVTFGFGRLPGR
jgi:hypothetical protein